MSRLAHHHQARGSSGGPGLEPTRSSISTGNPAETSLKAGLTLSTHRREKNGLPDPPLVEEGANNHLESRPQRHSLALKLLTETILNSRANHLPHIVALLGDPATEIGRFLTQDLKGRQVIEYLAQMSVQLESEHRQLVETMQMLSKSAADPEDVSTAPPGSVTSPDARATLDVAELVEETLRANATFIERGRVKVVRDYSAISPVFAPRQPLLQILLSLVNNAKNALAESDVPVKELTLRVQERVSWVKISVTDNGIGIPPENLSLVFCGGFTTRKEGHGFSLHDAARAAAELGGTIQADSEGAGRGATFTLELPATPTGS